MRLAPGLYICILNHEKNCIKSDFKELSLKLATNDQSDKMCLLTKTRLQRDFFFNF